MTASTPLRRMRRASLRPIQGMRGMSLVEVLTSVLIFSIGLIALVGLQSRAVRFSMSAEDTNRAALLANEISSDMQLKRSTTLTAAELAAWNTRVGDATKDGLPQGAVAVDPIPSTTNQTDITITWTPPGGTQSRYKTQVILP